MYLIILSLSTLMYSSSTEFKIQFLRAMISLWYLVYCSCCSEKRRMAS